MIVHAADIQDADGAGELLRRLKRLYPWLRAVFADSAYNRVATLLACFLLRLLLILVPRPTGSQGFALVPRRCDPAPFVGPGIRGIRELGVAPAR